MFDEQVFPQLNHHVPLGSYFVKVRLRDERKVADHAATALEDGRLRVGSVAVFAPSAGEEVRV